MKKFMKIILWTLLILVLVVIIGGFIFIKTFDLNKYKSYAEKVVYEQTGRQLSLNGDAGLKISLIPTVALNDVALSNADWAKEPEMIKAKTVEVSLSVLPLLKKEIVIDTVNLVNPEVYLSVNKDGKGNWDFNKPSAPADQPHDTDSKTNTPKAQINPAAAAVKADKAPAAVQAAQGAAFTAIVAKNLTIENGTLVYSDLKSGSSQNLKIKSLSLTSEGMDDDINLDFDVIYNGDEIKGTAAAGSVNAILRNNPDYPLTASVKAFGATVKANMKLNDLLNDLRYAGTVSLVNPAGNFGAPAVNLQSKISGSTKNAALDISSLNIGGNVISGRINADLSKSKPYITGNLQSSEINLQTLTAAPKTAFEFNLISSASAAQFVPNTRLDLSALNSVNANLKVTINKLIVDNRLSIGNLQTTAVLNNGQLTLNPLTVALGGGTASGTVSINASNALNINLVGKGIVLQNLWNGFAVSGNQNFGFVSGGKTDFTLKISGQGATLRQIVEGLNGQTIIVIGDSKIQTGSLKYLSGNFVTQLLSALNLQKQSKNMDLTCAVVRADINSGKAVFPKGIVFNAKQMVIVSDGSVNLRNDKLDLTIHPFNGKIVDTNVVQAISSLIKISGTIQSPRISLDNSAVIKNIVGVAAAGPAFLGSQLLLDADDSPCYTALKGTTYQSMFPAPKGAQAAGQGVYKGTTDVINGGVNVITDTAKDVLKLFKGKK